MGFALGLTAVATGCSGADVSVAEPQSNASKTVITVAPTEIFANPQAEVGTEPAAPDAVIERSPIDRLVGFETDPQILSQAYEERSMAYADELTDCMAKRGFDGYRARVLDWPTPEDLLQREPVANIALYGYGPTIVLRSRAEGQFTPEPEPEPDPSADYLAAHPDMDEHTFFSNQDSCRSRAAARHPRPEPTFSESLAEEIAQVRVDANRSPEVLAAWDAWSICMASEGYRVADRHDARASIEERAAPLLELLNQLARDNRGPSDAERAAFEQAIDDLAREEEAIVAADLACDAEVGVDTITAGAIHAAESAWIDENGDRVSLLLAEQ